MVYRSLKPAPAGVIPPPVPLTSQQARAITQPRHPITGHFRAAAMPGYEPVGKVRLGPVTMKTWARPKVENDAV